MRLQSKSTVKCLPPGQGDISRNSIRGFRGASVLFRRRRKTEERDEGRESEREKERKTCIHLAETVLFCTCRQTTIRPVTALIQTAACVSKERFNISIFRLFLSFLSFLHCDLIYIISTFRVFNTKKYCNAVVHTFNLKNNIIWYHIQYIIYYT